LLAQGYEIADALVIAKAYVNQGLRLAPQLGAGHGPLAHVGWPETERDLPWLTHTAEEGIRRPQFPDCGDSPLGFYPIVPNTEWLERILPLGVATVQLRIKNKQGAALEREIADAIACARRYGARLFVNDYWQLALKHGAYGVHLGQEDLETADIAALAQAGIRLGVSTHCYAEVAHALALRPSYIAIGPVFHTTTNAACLLIHWWPLAACSATMRRKCWLRGWTASR
jgi:hydroxymethylpyrimidine kinase/phosphomethylpyrimidine kinase/thiamine-phosphate diphosphorylase